MGIARGITTAFDKQRQLAIQRAQLALQARAQSQQRKQAKAANARADSAEKRTQEQHAANLTATGEARDRAAKEFAWTEEDRPLRKEAGELGLNTAKEGAAQQKTQFDQAQEARTQQQALITQMQETGAADRIMDKYSGGGKFKDTEFLPDGSMRFPGADGAPITIPAPAVLAYQESVTGLKFGQPETKAPTGPTGLQTAAAWRQFAAEMNRLADKAMEAGDEGLAGQYRDEAERALLKTRGLLKDTQRAGEGQQPPAPSATPQGAGLSGAVPAAAAPETYPDDHKGVATKTLRRNMPAAAPQAPAAAPGGPLQVNPRQPSVAGLSVQDVLATLRRANPGMPDRMIIENAVKAGILTR
jgi:hypothetical protein